jgi:hypothetical protein
LRRLLVQGLLFSELGDHTFSHKESFLLCYLELNHIRTGDMIERVYRRWLV